jgi:hypothetical protein
LWCTTTGGHIGFESRLAYYHLMLLDHDQAVVGKARSHAADYFAGNVRWLAGYRHPRPRLPDVAEALSTVFAQPLALMDGRRWPATQLRCRQCCST